MGFDCSITPENKETQLGERAIRGISLFSAGKQKTTVSKKSMRRIDGVAIIRGSA
jgi:hypothetical protein